MSNDWSLPKDTHETVGQDLNNAPMKRERFVPKMKNLNFL